MKLYIFSFCSSTLVVSCMFLSTWAILESFLPSFSHFSLHSWLSLCFPSFSIPLFPESTFSTSKSFLFCFLSISFSPPSSLVWHNHFRFFTSPLVVSISHQYILDRHNVDITQSCSAFIYAHHLASFISLIKIHDHCCFQAVSLLLSRWSQNSYTHLPCPLMKRLSSPAVVVDIAYLFQCLLLQVMDPPSSLREKNLTCLAIVYWVSSLSHFFTFYSFTYLFNYLLIHFTINRSQWFIEYRVPTRSSFNYVV